MATGWDQTTGSTAWANTYPVDPYDTTSGVTWTATSATTTDNCSYHDARWATPNVQITFRAPEIYDIEKRGTPFPSKSSGIHPRLYFKYVKSKMNKLQQDKLKDRLAKLQKLVKQTKEMGQRALHEEFAKKIAEIVKESEAAACGITHSVPKEVIQKYRYKVRGNLDIVMEELKDYDRVVPAAVVRKVRMCRKLGLFDKYWVLYIDHREKTDVDKVKKVEKKLKTTKEKIKEKDPILFGTHDFNPNTMYFIIDWIDEYCDLTIDKFVEDVKKDDPEFNLDKTPEMNKAEMTKVVKEVQTRSKRLRITTQENFRRLMKLEEWRGFPTRIKEWYLQKWRDMVLDTQMKEFDKWKRNLSKERREARFKLLGLKAEVYLDTAFSFLEKLTSPVNEWIRDVVDRIQTWYQEFWDKVRGDR